ncbi:hypothetical protein TcWFU_003930 [Taenia crassiceps]|uniref:Uncharacterized protein n=1 Tax=Taenia crassiceps TaxID=6207 RepID=A0ABR4Q4D4_9CEST
MSGCKKDGGEDTTVAADAREDSLPLQEQSGEVNYDADDEGDSNEEDSHTEVTAKTLPCETLPNVVREVESTSPSSRSTRCRAFAAVVCINDRALYGCRQSDARESRAAAFLSLPIDSTTTSVCPPIHPVVSAGDAAFKSSNSAAVLHFCSHLVVIFDSTSVGTSTLLKHLHWRQLLLQFSQVAIISNPQGQMASRRLGIFLAPLALRGGEVCWKSKVGVSGYIIAVPLYQAVSAIPPSGSASLVQD